MTKCITIEVEWSSNAKLTWRIMERKNGHTEAFTQPHGIADVEKV